MLNIGIRKMVVKIKKRNLMHFIPVVSVFVLSNEAQDTTL